MNALASAVETNWSVWDANPVVTWKWGNQVVQVKFENPPIAIAVLDHQQWISIVGRPEEFGAANLVMYSYDGMLQKSYSAPALGGEHHFGGVRADGDGVEVIISFTDQGDWKEKAGTLDVATGNVTDLRRSY